MSANRRTAPASAPTLEAFQATLGRHVRNPRQSPRPKGVSPRRVAIYTELVFNNLNSLLQPCFPITRAVLGDRWTRLVRQFCSEARCQTPLFREVPGEFLQWLLNADTSVRLPPWLRELAHHEWVELAVDVMDVEVLAASDAQALTDQTLISGQLRFNPSLLNLHYQWPVHRIGPDYRPRQAKATRMLVYRDANDTVRFMAITPASARLLHLMSSGPMSLADACQAVAGELGQNNVGAVQAAGLSQCRQWIDADVILGVNKK